MKVLMKAVAAVAVAVVGFTANGFAGWTYDSTTKTLTDGDWTFNCTLSSSKLAISSVKTAGTTDKVIDLNDYSGTYPIDAIGKNALNNKPGIAKLILPETLTSVGEYSVSSCANLTDLYLPSGITTIGNYAFQSCTSLTNVVPFLPDSLTSVGPRAFQNDPICVPLVITAPGLTEIKGESGYGVFAGTKIPFVDLSQSVITSIGSMAFSGCSELTEIKLPPNLTTIGSYVFQSCKKLKKVTPLLPDTLTSIGARTFYNTPVEGELRISNPDFVTLSSEEGYAQFGASKITRADFSGSGMTTVGAGAFRGCSTLTNVVLSEVLTTVGSRAFECSNLKDVYFTSLTRLASFTGFQYMGLSGCNTRFCYPINASESWDAERSAKFVAWDSFTQAERDQYTAAFPDGPTPVGRDTFAGNKVHCLVPIKDTSGKVNVLIEGSPVKAGEPDPDYGDYKDVGASIEGSVPQYGVDGHGWYESTGYRLDTQDDAGHWVAGTVVSERTISNAPGEGGNYRLVWLWDLRGWRVALKDYCTDLGSVGVTTPDHGTEYYSTGRPVVLTATARSGATFERWYGDVPEGREKENPLTLTADGEQYVWPYFTKGWEFCDSGKMITDGEWALSVSVTDGKVTITGVKTNGVAGVVDLRKPVVGGSVIVALGESAFTSNKNIQELRLPDTLRSVGYNVCDGCSNLRRVVPFLPKSVTYIGSRSFLNVPVEGELVLSNKGLTSIPGEQNYGAFNGTKITSADLSKCGLKIVEDGLFRGCTLLKSIAFPAALESIQGLSFDNDKALMDASFRSCPTLGGTVFRNCTGLPSRVTFPKGDAGWMKRIADAGTGFHSWASATTAQSNDYFANFPARPVPLGYMSVGGVNKWLVPVSEGGMRVLFR